MGKSVDEELLPIDEVHTYLLYLLKQINNVCEKYDIPCLAYGGTLLGAVRHKGFIPWDDDIDLVMERKYYNRFIEACENLLPEEIVIRTREKDPFFCEEYLKICFKDDKIEYSELAIDIFLLDETDSKRKLFRAFQNFIISNVRPLKLYKASRQCPYMEKYVPHNKIKHFLLQFFSFIPLSFLTNIQSWAMTAEHHSTDYFVDWGCLENYKKATRPKIIFREFEKIPFENVYINATKYRNQFLEDVYGKDYMTPPPIEKQHVHNVHRITNNRLSYETIKESVLNE